MFEVLGVLLLVYLAFCALLYLFQRSLLYMPQPAPRGAAAAATFTLPVDGAQLQIVHRPNSGDGAVIYFGGNAESVAYSLPELAEAFPNRALYLMNYRGYGGSSGSPTEAALLADAQALFDRVHREHPRVVLVGRSLGSGIATYLASVRPAERLVLITPYDSIQAIAERHYPIFPVRWLLQDKYEAWRHAGKVDIPTVLIVAEHDEVIPRRSSEALSERFRSGIASMHILPRTGHNTISNSPDYRGLLAGAE